MLKNSSDYGFGRANKLVVFRPFSWLFYFSYSMEKVKKGICQLVGFGLLLSS